MQRGILASMEQLVSMQSTTLSFFYLCVPLFRKATENQSHRQRL